MFSFNILFSLFSNIVSKKILIKHYFRFCLSSLSSFSFLFLLSSLYPPFIPLLLSFLYPPFHPSTPFHSCSAFHSLSRINTFQDRKTMISSSHLPNKDLKVTVVCCTCQVPPFFNGNSTEILTTVHFKFIKQLEL